MHIQQLYTNCLAHAAYYIESGNEAAVIDPLRDPAPYLQLAAERGATIKYVLETHFHADFVSGHIDLANASGATIVFGPNAQPGYKAYVAEDGEQLHLGAAKLEVLHTPGHTIESACFLLIDEQGVKTAVFTGDTLFVGDVGRPDLLSGNLPKEALAEMLFDSLQNKIKTLPDTVVVYPGHGAGSACGKNIGSSSFSTIGAEKASNYALLANDKETFVQAVTSDLPYIPGYFFTDAHINRHGSSPFQDVLEQSLQALSADSFAQKQEEGATVLDTRDPMDFAAGHIRGAINIGLNGDFAVWVGTLLDATTPLLLVVDTGKEKEAVTRLARIGFEKVIGYLQGCMTSWFAADKPFEHIATVTGSECTELLETATYELLDVRNRRETAKNHIAGATHIPLNMLRKEIATLDPNQKWLIYCAGGYRSMIAASFLAANGFHFVASIEGGMKEVLTHAPHLVTMEEE